MLQEAPCMQGQSKSLDIKSISQLIWLIDLMWGAYSILWVCMEIKV